MKSKIVNVGIKTQHNIFQSWKEDKSIDRYGCLGYV